MKQIFIVLLFLLTLSSCQWQETKTLRVGTTKAYPPLCFLDNGKLSGLEIDFAKGLAKELSLQLELKVMPFSDLIEQLKNQEIDLIMAGMTKTTERSFAITFLPPYANIKQVLLIKKSKKVQFQRMTSSFKSKITLGYKERSTGEKIIENQFIENKNLSFQDTAKGVQALLNGEIDCFIYDSPATASYVKKHPELTTVDYGMSSEALAWAVNNTNLTLHHQLNEIYLKWKANGTLDRYLNKWLPNHKLQ